MQLQKSPLQSLTSCYSILDGKDGSNTKGRPEEGSPTGVPSAGTPSSPREMEKRKRQLEALEAVREIARILPTQVLARLAAEVVTSTSSQGASHIRPIIWGKATCKEFFKGGLKDPRCTGQGWWFSTRLPVPEEY